MNATVQPNFDASTLASDTQRTAFLIRSMLFGVRTAIPVEVIAVHPGTGTPPSIGTVDVKPLVQTVDGNGNLWPLQVVYGVPFCRIQSGGTAIIVDPSVGDIGLATACDRDISSVTASGGQLSGPGSSRRHNMSDLVYVLSIISAAPITQYILANANGITMLSPNAVNIQAPNINLKGDVTQTGGIFTTPDVIVPNGSVNGHVHEVIEIGEPTGGMTG